MGHWSTLPEIGWGMKMLKYTGDINDSKAMANYVELVQSLITALNMRYK